MHGWSLAVVDPSTGHRLDRPTFHCMTCGAWCPAEDDVLCPWGDQMHVTDDRYGGPCSGCIEATDRLRDEWEADQMEGMRMPWDS